MTKAWGQEDWARLGEEIRDRRLWMHMEQRDLAQLAQVSENTIGNYERGRVPARGKVPPGYKRVEAALRWSAGSVERILNDKGPILEVEGPANGRYTLRSPDDPAYKDDPFMQAYLAALDEAFTAKRLAMVLADTALRWGAPQELIDAYLKSAEELMIEMVTPGRGPEYLRQEYQKRKAAEGDALDSRVVANPSGGEPEA